MLVRSSSIHSPLCGHGWRSGRRRDRGTELPGVSASDGIGLADRSLFEPRGALAHAAGAPFSGTFIVARTKTCPRDQMGRRGEARHIDADLRHHDLRGQIADTGQGRE